MSCLPLGAKVKMGAKTKKGIDAAQHRQKGGFARFSATEPFLDMTTTLDGTKWVVDGYKNNQKVDVKVESTKQSVRIFGCDQTVIVVSGKCSSISVGNETTASHLQVNCKKTAVIFEDIIATVEVTNSKSTQLQANGSVPAISIDGSQGATIYLQTPAGQQVGTLHLLTNQGRDRDLRLLGDQCGHAGSECRGRRSR